MRWQLLISNLYEKHNKDVPGHEESPMSLVSKKGKLIYVSISSIKACLVANDNDIACAHSANGSENFFFSYFPKSHALNNVAW